MFKFADIDGTNMSIEFRTASGNVVHIGLDGLSNTFFAEDTGTNIAGILTFENNNQVWDEDSTNELSMIRILRRNSLVSCYVNDFKIFENVDWMPGAISAIARDEDDVLSRIYMAAHTCCCSLMMNALRTQAMTLKPPQACAVMQGLLSR